MIHHFDGLTASGVCGAQPTQTETMSSRWAVVECLKCVALKHPSADQRRRAWVKLQGGGVLPASLDPAVVDAWLDA